MKHLLRVLLIVLTSAAAGSAQTPPPVEAPKPQPPSSKPQPPAAPAKPQTPPQTPAPATRAQPRPPAGGVALTVQVTDRSGNGIADVAVRTIGPVDRTGATAPDGSVTFRAMRAGTYRLRFEKEGFTTFEREVPIASRAADVSVALTPAPPPPQPPPAPAQQSTAPPARPTRTVEPRALSIIEYLDRNLIGSEAVKTSMLACADGGTAVLLQVREPLTELQHAESDEILYVVAGNGILRMRNQDTKIEPGYFALVPRGMSHSLRRDGRNALIAVSVLIGSPCTETTPAVK